MKTKGMTMDVEGLVRWLGAGSPTRQVTPSPSPPWGAVEDKVFVDSVLRGFPIPPLWVGRAPWVTSGGDLGYWIVDGNHRVDALDRFVKGDFALLSADDAALCLPSPLRRQGASWAGRRFDELSRRDRMKLLRTGIEVRVISHATLDELVAFAIRLQASPLTAVGDGWGVRAS